MIPLPKKLKIRGMHYSKCCSLKMSRSIVSNGLFYSILLLHCSLQVLGQQLFSNRLLRNPGLTTINNTCLDYCISQCKSTTGCSAISYRMSTGTCVMSKCNNLDLFSVLFDWSTYIMDSYYVESDVQPVFEWMLTDTCGTQNQGVVNGPPLQLYNVQYAAAQSAYSGSAPKFAGDSTSYGLTQSNSILYSSIGSKSQLTIMFWAKWDVSQVTSNMFEFSRSLSNRGWLFWIYGGGLWYDLSQTSSCTYTCALNSFSIVPIANTWYHITYSYDGANSMMKTYLNFTLVAVNKVISGSNVNWDTIQIAYSSFPSAGAMKGSMYCYKVFNISLTGSQVQAFGQSCLTAKARFSGRL